MSKGTSLSQLIKRFVKEEIKSNSGEIYFYPNKYVYDDNPPADVLEELMAGKLAVWRMLPEPLGNSRWSYEYGDTGRIIRLTRGYACFCSYEIWKGDYPAIKNEKWKKPCYVVPRSVCRKCLFYRKAKSVEQRYNWPICARRNKAKPELEAAQALNDVISNAGKMMDDIFK